MSAKRYLLTMSCVYQLGVVSGNFVSPDWECICWVVSAGWSCESVGSVRAARAVCCCCCLCVGRKQRQASSAWPALPAGQHLTGLAWVWVKTTLDIATHQHTCTMYTPPLSLSHTDITLSLPYHHLKLIHSKQAPAPTRRPPSQGRGRAWLCL